MFKKLKKLYQEWNNKSINTFASACTFYLLASYGSLLVVISSVLTTFNLESNFLEFINMFLGEQYLVVSELFLQSGNLITGSIFGILLLLYTSTSFFIQLRTGIRIILDKKEDSIVKTLIMRIRYFFNILIVSLFLAIIFFSYSFFNLGIIIGFLPSFLFSFLVLFLGLYLVYRYKLDLKSAFFASFISSFSFVIIKIFYDSLAFSSASLQNVIGSVLGFLFLAYFFIIIFFAGVFIGKTHWTFRVK